MAAPYFYKDVIPAKAGIQNLLTNWTPAFAGVTILPATRYRSGSLVFPVRLV
jgi:hypothetical protein